MGLIGELANLMTIDSECKRDLDGPEYEVISAQPAVQKQLTSAQDALTGV